MKPWIYLDNSATTPPFPEVVEAVTKALRDGFGNPSSIHGAGQEARRLVDAAREQVAALVGCRPTEAVFTSGATESTNAALKGVLAAVPASSRHIITTTVEHEATIEVCRHLELEGVRISRIAVDSEGRLDMGAYAEALKLPTAVVSVMLVNNETGVIFPVPEIARMAREAGALVHVDAVQAIGKFPVRVEDLGADLISLSAHKFHGPKGTGLLYVRRGSRWKPLLVGASHEGSRRAGTENVPGIAGFGVAASRMASGIEARARHLGALGARIRGGLARIPRHRISGKEDIVAPGIVNVCFEGIEGSAVVLTAARDGVCLSAGSACSAAQYGGSHVLEAMAVPFEFLHGAVRFSCSELTTPAEVDRAMEVVEGAVAYLRRMDPAAARTSSSGLRDPEI